MGTKNERDAYIKVISENIKKAQRNLEVAEEIFNEDHYELKAKIINKYKVQIDTLTKLKDNLNKH